MAVGSSRASRRSSPTRSRPRSVTTASPA